MGGPFLAFPIRIERSCWFRRAATADETLVQLLGIMARTASDGGWPGVKEFGLRDYFANISTRRGLQTEAIQAANRILTDLGIDWVRIEAVTKEESPRPDEAIYSVAVSFLGKGTEVLKVRV